MRLGGAQFWQCHTRRPGLGTSTGGAPPQLPWPQRHPLFHFSLCVSQGRMHACRSLISITRARDEKSTKVISNPATWCP